MSPASQINTICEESPAGRTATHWLLAALTVFVCASIGLLGLLVHSTSHIWDAWPLFLVYVTIVAKPGWVGSILYVCSLSRNSPITRIKCFCISVNQGWVKYVLFVRIISTFLQYVSTWHSSDYMYLIYFSH